MGDPADIVYGTAIDDVQLNAEVNEAVLQDGEGNSQGTFAHTVGGADAAGQILEVGTHTIAVAYTPAEEDTNAYIGATETVEITVTQAPLTVTIANIEHTYGDPLPRIDAADATRLNIAGWIWRRRYRGFRRPTAVVNQWLLSALLTQMQDTLLAQLQVNYISVSWVQRKITPLLTTEAPWTFFHAS